MKRFLTILFAVSFVLTAAFCTTVQAADYDIQYEIADIECAVGDQIRVPVYVDVATEGIATICVDVYYDPDVLEFVDFDTTGGFAPTSKQGVISHELFEIGDAAALVNFFPTYEPAVGRHLFVTIIFDVIGGEAGESYPLEGEVWSADWNESFDFGSVIIPAAGCEHAKQTTTTVDAKCGVAGSTTVTCDDCGETLSTSEIPALVHTAGAYLSDDEGHWTECIYCGTVMGEKAAHVEEGTCVCGKEIVPPTPVVYEIIDDKVYGDGELVPAYQTVVVDGKTYFIGDYNKIVKNKAVFVDGAWMPFGADGALTTEAVVLPVNSQYSYAFANGTRVAANTLFTDANGAVYFVGDAYRVVANKEVWVNGTYWYFGADGVKATGTVLVNDRVYVDGEWLRAYTVVEIEGNYYFVSDYHKIAKNTTVYVNDPQVGKGYFTVDAAGIIEIAA